MYKIWDLAVDLTYSTCSGNVNVPLPKTAVEFLKARGS